MKVYFLKKLILHRSDTRGRNESQNTKRCSEQNCRRLLIPPLPPLHHVQTCFFFKLLHAYVTFQHAMHVSSLPMPCTAVSPTLMPLFPAHQCTRDCLLPSLFTNLPAWVDAQHTTPTALCPQPCLLHPCLHLPTNHVELPSQLAIKGHK